MNQRAMHFEKQDTNIQTLTEEATKIIQRK